MWVRGTRHTSNDNGPEFVVREGGTKSIQAFGFCVWECVLGTGNGEGNTLVAPLWRRRCEREIYAPIAPLRRGRRERVTGWAWTGGALMPRHHCHHLDQDEHRQDGHSRLRATRLANEQGSQPPLGIRAGPEKNGIVDPRDPAQNPSGPTGFHVTRPTGYSTGGWVAKLGN